MRKYGRAAFGAALAALFVLGTASVPAGAAQGSPDKTFGSGGKKLTPGGAGTGYYEDVALQSDGKIVAFGVRGNTNTDAVFTRYTTTGDVDTTFGTNGTFELWIGPADIDQLPLPLLQQTDGNRVD